MSARTLLTVAPLLLFSLGCSATFQSSRQRGEERTSWSHFFVYGAIGHHELDARDMCESAKLRRVTSGANGLTLGASVLTLGLYTPRRVVYECEEPGQ